MYMGSVGIAPLFPHGVTAASGPRPFRYRGYTVTLRHTSGRVISPSQRHLLAKHTTLTTVIHAPRRVSNP